MALAITRRRRPGIVFALFGDGAMGEGAMHEALNLAALWRLPVLFVCESNAAGLAGRANAFAAARELRDLAAVHQIPAMALDGGDVEALALAFGEAAAAVRAHEGPRFLEARTPPWPGNASFLPTLATGELDLREAAAAASVEGWAALDPVAREARALLGAGTALERLLELDRAEAAACAAAFERAEAAPLAPAAAALEGVWST
jgi:pyruvate dehydrogenase E1 component alpha subunit